MASVATLDLVVVLAYKIVLECCSFDQNNSALSLRSVASLRGHACVTLTVRHNVRHHIVGRPVGRPDADVVVGPQVSTGCSADFWVPLVAVSVLGNISKFAERASTKREA